MKIYLDLLPQEKKTLIKRKKRFRSLVRGQLLFAFPLVVFICLLVNVYYLADLKLKSMISMQAGAQAKEQYQQLNQYEEKFVAVNKITDQILKIEKSHLHWTNVLITLDQVIPEGINLTNLATKNYQVMVVGNARTRDDLLVFKEKLESIECFEAVNIPLSNLVVKDNVAFNLDFKVKKDCLIKNQ